ncbi:MAG: hypothetical protein GY829_03610 [Gammaproteobacteria bacterium]|nr:hypothetical protein [Gammaproteobacteria bacterium]
MNKPLISIFIALIISVLFMTEVSAAKFYRFTDAAGKKVVSSTLPPEISQLGYDIVNEMGVVLEKVAPRKTQQQLMEEFKNKAKIEKERQRLIEQQQLDFILINSYTDISDIERARDNELFAKDRDINLLKQYILRLTRQLEDAQARAARDERLGKEISQKILDEVDGFKELIKREKDEVDVVEKLKVSTNERYSVSIARFSELKAAEQLRRFSPGELPIDDSQTVIYNCTSNENCDLAWQAGLLYASENSTTELAWTNKSTIMMRKPKKDHDISIMVTKVNSDNDKESRFVLEVRCNKTQAGEELCQSEIVDTIKKGFIPFIKLTIQRNSGKSTDKLR